MNEREKKNASMKSTVQMTRASIEKSTSTIGIPRVLLLYDICSVYRVIHRLFVHADNFPTIYDLKT